MIEPDLLIVGGDESAVAAAIQAARMGQRRIVLVNDIAWLGGEFGAEAVGAIDEWMVRQGKSANFPRSGLFLEVLERIRQYNLKKYGLASPATLIAHRRPSNLPPPPKSYDRAKQYGER